MVKINFKSEIQSSTLKKEPNLDDTGKLGDKKVRHIPTSSSEAKKSKPGFFKCLAFPFVFVAKKIAAFVVMIFKGIAWLFGFRGKKKTPTPQPQPEKLSNHPSRIDALDLHTPTADHKKRSHRLDQYDLAGDISTPKTIYQKPRKALSSPSITPPTPTVALNTPQQPKTIPVPRSDTPNTPGTPATPVVTPLNNRTITPVTPQQPSPAPSANFAGEINTPKTIYQKPRNALSSPKVPLNTVPLNTPQQPKTIPLPRSDSPNTPSTPATPVVTPLNNRTITPVTPQPPTPTPSVNYPVANVQQHSGTVAPSSSTREFTFNFNANIAGNQLPGIISGKARIQHLFDNLVNGERPFMLFQGRIRLGNEVRDVELILDPQAMGPSPIKAIESAVASTFGINTPLMLTFEGKDAHALTFDTSCSIPRSLARKPTNGTSFEALDLTPPPSLGKMKANRLDKYDLAGFHKLNREELRLKLERLANKENKIMSQIEQEVKEARQREALALEEFVEPSSIADRRRELGLGENQCNLVSYLNNYRNELSNVESSWILMGDPNDLTFTFRLNPNDSIVTFMNGKTYALDPKASAEEKKKAVDQFLHLIEETYGSHVRVMINARYELHKLEKLTLGDIKKTLIGIAANVRKIDLERLFETIKEDSQPFSCKDFLKESDPEGFQSLKEAESFDALSPKQLALLVSAFRTVPTKGENGGLEAKNIIDELYPDIQQVLVTNIPKIFELDLDMLAKFEQWNQLDLVNHDLALSEHPGKTLAYCDLEEGMIFALPDKDNNPHYYCVNKQFEENHVIPAIIEPLNPNQKAYRTHKEKDIHLVFRGTVTMMQWFRNTDFRGVGKNAFAKTKAKIIDMVRECIQNNGGDDITLHISGHSLGGCDTQRAYTLIMQQIADSDEDSPFRKIKNMIVLAHNPPRPEPELNQELKHAVAKMIEKEIGPEEVIAGILRFFDESYQDPVSALGEVYVGSDKAGGTVTVNGEEEKFIFKRAEFIKRMLIDINIELKDAGILGRHTFRPFNKVQKGDVNWHFRNIRDASNKSERMGLEERFARLHHWSNKAGIRRRLNWHLLNVGAPLKNGAHLLVNYVVGAIAGGVNGAYAVKDIRDRIAALSLQEFLTWYALRIDLPTKSAAISGASSLRNAIGSSSNNPRPD